jgi:prepilin-type processing-associated H-X9-DG protein
MAITVPAVQRTRDAANRLACANNLRQIALAAHMYHDANKSFPAGVRWQNGTDPYAYMTWLAQLLPFLEQQNLWELTVQAYQATRIAGPYPYFPATGPHAPLFATAIPIFSCPADGRVSQTQIFLNGGTDPLPVGLTDYLGVNGTNYQTRDGIFFQDSRVRLTDIIDGTSQTLLIGERPPPADFEWGWWYAGAGQGFTGSCEVTLGVQELLYSNMPCPPGPYFFHPGSLADVCDSLHFWSRHPTGANFAYADGSVHFLPYSAVPILAAMATRNGGEVVPQLGQ